MQNVRFFEKKGPSPFSEIVKKIDPTKDLAELNNFKIYGIDSLINAKENEIIASFQNGLLTLEIPKQEAVKPKAKKIAIK